MTQTVVTQQLKDANGNIIYVSGYGSGANTGAPFSPLNNAIITDPNNNQVTVATAGADANTNTVNLFPTLNYLLGFNGTTWDRLQVDGNKYLKVNLSTALPAGTNNIGGVFGDVASGATNSGNPLQGGGVAHTANPTAVTDGQRVARMLDKIGRTVAVNNQVRQLTAVQPTTITSSTTETTIVTAGAAGVLNDLLNLIFSNSSATGTVVTLRDSTAGSTRGIFFVPADSTITIPFNTVLAQGTAANNWTITCGTSVASVYVTAQYAQNV